MMISESIKMQLQSVFLETGSASRIGLICWLNNRSTQEIDLATWILTNTYGVAEDKNKIPWSELVEQLI